MIFVRFSEILGFCSLREVDSTTCPFFLLRRLKEAFLVPKLILYIYQMDTLISFFKSITCFNFQRHYTSVWERTKHKLHVSSTAQGELVASVVLEDLLNGFRKHSRNLSFQDLTIVFIITGAM